MGGIGGGHSGVGLHAQTHSAPGTDPLRLDELAEPEDTTALDATTAAHGLLQKLPGDTSTFLRADGTFAAPDVSTGSDATLATSDITTNNVSTTKHGFAPKLPNVATQFLNGVGTYTVPTTVVAHVATHANGGSDELVVTGLSGVLADAQVPQGHTHGVADIDSLSGLLGTLDSDIDAITASAERTANKNAAGGYAGLTASKLNGAQQAYGSAANTACEGNDTRLSNSRIPLAHTHDEVEIVLTDVTTNDVSTDQHGFAPKLPGDGTLFLDGVGGWAAPATSDATLTLSDVTTNDTSTTQHGFAPKLPGDPFLFLNGEGEWIPSEPPSGVFTFTQTEPELIWTIEHDLGAKGVNLVITDEDDLVILPDSITLNDNSTATVVFTVAQAGIAYVQVGAAGVSPGSGGVVGPDESSESHFAAFADETGKLLVDSGVGYMDIIDGALFTARNPDATNKLIPIHLDTEVTGLLSLNNLAHAPSDSMLLGRDSSGGAGHWQPLALGDGLEVTGTTLDVTSAISALVATVATLVSTLATRDAEVALTDGIGPTIDASLGYVFRLAAAGNRTLSAPTNPRDGQRIIIQHYASGDDRTLSLNIGAGGFRFGVTVTALTTTVSGKTDYIGCVYNSTDGYWDVVSVAKEF